MKKLIALLLALLMLNLSLSSCFFKNTEDIDEEYYWGNRGLGYPRYQDLNALVKSDKNEFDINDVTLDFYYCFYSLDDETLEEAKESHTSLPNDSHNYEEAYAIYFSHGALDFEMGDNYRIFDYEKVNAQLYKFITFEEAYETNYGYTRYGINIINYNYCEKLTIPAECFVSSSSSLFIDVMKFTHDLDEDVYYLTPFHTSIQLNYELNGDKVIILKN